MILKLIGYCLLGFSIYRFYHNHEAMTLGFVILGEQGNTIDFLLTSKRDTKAAKRFFEKSIGRNGKPGLINIDKSGANKAGINQYNTDNNRRIKIRQCKYLNNIVEQDHRRIKRITRSMLGFKSFRCAQSTLAGIGADGDDQQGTNEEEFGWFIVARRAILRFSYVNRKLLCRF